MQSFLKNGTVLLLHNTPSELTAQVPKGDKLRFSIEETPDNTWDIDFNPGECHINREHRAGTIGVQGLFVIEAESKVQTPVRLELADKQGKKLRLILYTVGQKEAVNPNYPHVPLMNMLKETCKARGIVITDYHIHIRGGMTPALAAQRELNSGIHSSAMENHGREWEIYDNAKLRQFAENARTVSVNGHTLPVGIQVNDRDWFIQIDQETRNAFDYILADTMIMGKLPSGRDNRLWLDQSIPAPAQWMEQYIKHNLQILGEPITILANPTYLPKEIAHLYDELWTKERMMLIIDKAVANNIALEIQAGSLFPRPNFLKLAKDAGAKFSFGTNNFDPAPKDLSKWLETIQWLNLTADNILS